ncbi:hypothetical protein RSAG8_02679, partial [Rhizoctonia solani AG-8 WAC10335]
MELPRLLLHLLFIYFSLVNAKWVYQPDAREHSASEEYLHQPCLGGNDGASQYFPNVIIDTVLPTSPDGVLDAMYTHREPVMDFWKRGQGFADFQTTGWFPQDPAYPNSRLRTRSTSFTKEVPDDLPLNHGLVGKRAKIEVIDTITHSEDGPSGTAILSTVRAPNLINGHAFSVRTRTCLVPEGASGTRLLITGVVRWNQ